MTTEFKQDNPGCGDDDCCGCPPATCTLDGEISGSNIDLDWTISSSDITSAIITNSDGDSYPLTVPPTSGTLSVPKSGCRQWTLTIIDDCGTSTCTFTETECTLEYLRTVPCETCADEDYPTVLITPRQAKISISGVTTGYNNPAPNWYACLPIGYILDGYGYRFWSEDRPGISSPLINKACETDVMADNPGFFNADFTLDPCTEINLYECRYKCSTKNTTVGSPPDWINLDYFEWNVLQLSYQPGVGDGEWDVVAMLHSWVAYYQRPTAGTICTSVGVPFGGPPRNITTHILNVPSLPSTTYAWLSYRAKTLSYHFSAGTRPGWFYDPGSCEDICNDEYTLASCLASGLTMSTASSTSNSTCPNEKALDVNSATAIVTIL